MSDEEKTLTAKEAYLAMFEYLNIHYKRFPAEQEAQIAIVLGELSLMQDGMPVDPAAWSDWEECIKKAKTDQVDSGFELKLC